MSRRTTPVLISILVALVAATALPAAEMEAEESAIREVVNTMWKQIGKKSYDGSNVHPSGAVQATSQGGLWQMLSREQLRSQINDSPNTLKLTPHHVHVRFLGSKKDVAHVSYYLTGRIERPDGGAIEDYRTRASMVLEKVEGRWVTSASHYSPLFGGSGVRFD